MKDQILPSYIAFLGIDGQPTFCEGGGLEISGGNAVIPVMNKVRARTEKGYWTQDWHPAGHSSFASTHGRGPFTKVWLRNGAIVEAGDENAIEQMLWPDHGLQGTAEAELHPGLIIRSDDMVLQKGVNPKIDSYSCIFENDKKTRPRFKNGNTLPEQLRADGVDTVLLSGLALDVCVADGACDLRDGGFTVFVILDATASISLAGQAAALDRFRCKGIEVTTSNRLMPEIFAAVKARNKTGLSPPAP